MMWKIVEDLTAAIFFGPMKVPESLFAGPFLVIETCQQSSGRKTALNPR